MNDFLRMNCPECCEQTAEIHAHLGYLHVSIVVPEVMMLEIGQHSDDLIMVAEGCDQRADRVRVFQVVEEFQLVEDSNWTAGDVDLLDGHIVGFSGGLLPAAW